MSRFVAALALGLAIRAATLTLPGHEDVMTWKIWSYAAARDVTGMYGVGGTPPVRGEVTWGDRWTTVDYPPMFLYEYRIVGRVFGALFPAYPDGRALLVAVKLPVLLANIGLTWVLFGVVRRIAGRDEPARWAALAYWLNPATIFGGEMLGYVDSLYMLPAIAGLALAHFGKPVWAGVLVAIAVSTKPQGILIGPAFALALWHAGGRRALAGAAVAFVATLCAVGLPFYVRGAIPNMLLAFGAFDTRRDTMSAYAANVGWIINWYLRSRFGIPELGARAFLQIVPRPLAISRFRELGYADPRLPGRAAVVAVTLWALWRARASRDLAIAAAVGAFGISAFFVLSVSLHEHHQLFAVPLLVLAAALRPGLRPVCWATSGIVAVNINALYGLGIGAGWAIPRTITGVDLLVVLAFVNIGTLVWFASRLTRETGFMSVRRSAENIG